MLVSGDRVENFPNGSEQTVELKIRQFLVSWGFDSPSVVALSVGDRNLWTVIRIALNYSSGRTHDRLA